MPNAEEIKKEIETLKEMKPKVRQYSAFGDDHHESIDAQIDVLENLLDGDEIYDRYENGPESVLDNAIQAREWLNDHNEAPSVGWKDLLIK